MIDHLVLATPDVAATADAVRAGWGIDVVAGGSHVGLGTCNQLADLGAGTYLEIVGPDPGQPDHRGPRPFGVDGLEQPALVTWCARPTRDLPAVVADLAIIRVDAGAPSSMSRQRPDGVLLQWSLTQPQLGPPHEGTVPFLIDWKDSPHPTSSLPSGATLVSLRLHHPHPDVLREVIGFLGFDERIEITDGPAHLSAVIETPAGIVTL